MAIGAAHPDLPRSECVLVLVDFINPLTFAGAQHIAAAAAQAAHCTAVLKRRLARKGVPVVYANDNYGRWHSNFQDVLSMCLERGGVSTEIARALTPETQDLTLLKPRHSAFHATPLDLLLTQMHARRLLIAGLATDNCVQFTAADAFLRGYAVDVASDCCAAETVRNHRDALAYMQRVMRCRIATSRTLLRSLKA